MTTLNDLERTGRQLIEANKRRVEEANRLKDEAEAHSKARMKDAVLDCLVQFCGLDNGDELEPLLIVDREYKRGTNAAHLNIPGVDTHVADIRFGYRAFQNPDDKDTLVIEMERASPFCFTWNNPTYYATLGEALYIARQKQVRADEYARMSDEEDRLATERYQAHQAKEAEEHNDRVSFLMSAIDEHPILFPAFKLVIAFLNREIELQDELDEALQ